MIGMTCDVTVCKWNDGKENCNCEGIHIGMDEEGKVVCMNAEFVKKDENSNELELIRCPFCGNDKIGIVSDKQEEYYFGLCSIYEKGCGAVGPRKKSKAKAIKAWNYRAN